VRAVPVAVRGTSTRSHFIDALGSAAPKIDMGEVDAGVDDVNRYVAGVVAVDVGAVERQVTLIDAVESPGGASLRVDGGHHLIRLDSHDARISRDRRSCRVGNVLHREAFERGLVHVLERTLVQSRDGLSDGGHIVDIITKCDYVVARDRNTPGGVDGGRDGGT